MVVLERSVSLLSGSDGLVGDLESVRDLLSVVQQGVCDRRRVERKEGTVDDNVGGGHVRLGVRLVLCVVELLVRGEDLGDVESLAVVRKDSLERGIAEVISISKDRDVGARGGERRLTLETRGKYPVSYTFPYQKPRMIGAAASTPRNWLNVEKKGSTSTVDP